MEAIRSNINVSYCDTHPKKQTEFICLDPKCARVSKICLLCIKKDHNNCRDEFLIQLADVAEKVELIRLKTNNKELVDKLNECFIKYFFELNRSISAKSESFVRALNMDKALDDVSRPGVIENLRGSFNVDYDAAHDRILLSSKLDSSNKQLNASMKHFEENLHNRIQSYVRSFEKLQFSVRGKLDVERWIKHQNILVEDKGGQLLISRASEDSSFNYYCAIYDVPLESHTRIKMTIRSIHDADRYLDFGIVDKTKFEAIQSNNFTNSFGSGGISYCGYSHTGGLTGKPLTTSSTDIEGFKPGEVCIMDYIPGQTIRFHNYDQTLDMSTSMIGKTEEPYFLFLVVYHPEASCTLECLN